MATTISSHPAAGGAPATAGTAIQVISGDRPATRYDAIQLLAFATAAGEAHGMTPQDARVTAEALVSTDLRGVMTHGLVRLPVYLANLGKGKVVAGARPSVVQEDGGTALVDGHAAMGQVACAFAMQTSIRLARANGVGTVAVRNSNHLGACAYYAMLAAEAGMVGICMTNGSSAMAPWGGVEARVGTNPFALAAPGPLDGEMCCPVVLDIAMTVGARGKIKMAQLRGEPLPPDWAFDALGLPTRDASKALGGSVAPMAGHKGYGLAVFVDLLTAALSGAALSPELENMGFTGDDRQPVRGPEAPGTGTGHWMLAVDVSRFLPLDSFRRRVRGYAAILKAAGTAPWAEGIYLPGELECRLEAERRAAGIPYEAHAVEALERVAQSTGVPLPQPLA